MTEIQMHSPRRRGKRAALATSLVSAFALLAMAFASGAQAAPTVLCKANQKPCSVANTYAAGTTVKATAKDFRIESTVDYTCSSVTAELKTAASLGEPLKAELTNFTFSGCKYALGSCGSVKTTNLTKPAIDQQGLDEAVAFPFGASWAWTCEGLSVGTWNATTVEALYGGGEFIIEEAPISCTGNCSEEGFLTAHFKVESPTPFYVEEGTPAGETTLCKVAEKYCAESNRYPVGTSFESRAEPLTIHTPLGNVKCPSSTMDVEQYGPNGEVGVLTWAISESCTRKAAGDCTVEVLEYGEPGLLSWGSYGPQDGLWTTEAYSKFSVECAAASLYCTYELRDHGEVGFETVLEGGNPAHFDLLSMHLEPIGPWCPKGEGFAGTSYISEGNFVFTSPKAVYVATS